MRSLKNHLSLIIPLFSIFFAIEFYLIVDKVIKRYEKNLSNDYVILVVAEKDLKKDEILSFIDISIFKEINPEVVVNRLKKEGAQIDFNSLKAFLPKFYTLSLKHFPSVDELNIIKNRLKSVDGIKRVETFSKTHSKIYNLLLIIKQVTKIFMIITAVMSFLLILKQILVWHLEHKDRMYIMELFGAPLWMRSGILIKIAILDTFLSTILLIASYFYILNSDLIKNLLSYLNIDIDIQTTILECFFIGGAGLILTIFSVIYVSIRQTRE